jgi:hypothetical protein
VKALGHNSKAIHRAYARKSDHAIAYHPAVAEMAEESGGHRFNG